jgi:hypothetical protein
MRRGKKNREKKSRSGPFQPPLAAFPLSELFAEMKNGFEKRGGGFGKAPQTPFDNGLEEQWLSKIAAQSSSIASHQINHVDSVSDKILDEIHRQRKAAADARVARIEALRHRGRRTSARIAACSSDALYRDALIHRKLLAQTSATDRRLQELLFETLGEYFKARARATRRSLHLSSTVDEQLEERSQVTLWNMFIARAQEDLRTVVLSNVEAAAEFAEASQFCAGLIARHVPPPTTGGGGGDAASPSVVVSRIVFVRPRSGKTSRRQRDNPNGVSQLVASSERDAIVDLLMHSFPRPKEPSEVDQVAKPAFGDSLLLSSRPLSWLLLPRWASRATAQDCDDDNDDDSEAPPRLVNCRVYFHVEARVARLQSSGDQSSRKDHEPSTAEKTQSLADAIGNIYTGGRVTVSSPPLPSRLVVSAAAQQHRSPLARGGSSMDAALQDRLLSYPDVLQVSDKPDGPINHFAPASIQTLLEVHTASFSEVELSFITVTVFFGNSLVVSHRTPYIVRSLASMCPHQESSVAASTTILF